MLFFPFSVQLEEELTDKKKSTISAENQRPQPDRGILVLLPLRFVSLKCTQHLSPRKQKVHWQNEAAQQGTNVFNGADLQTPGSSLHIENGTHSQRTSCYNCAPELYSANPRD
jgi:hypothetical protein